MTPINFNKISKKYAGSWIALDRENNKLITSGATLEEVVERAKKQGSSKPILTKVPSQNLGYIL